MFLEADPNPVPRRHKMAPGFSVLFGTTPTLLGGADLCGNVGVIAALPEVRGKVCLASR